MTIPSWSIIKELRKQYNNKQMATDISNLIISDLRKEGFEAVLTKKTRSPYSWRIEPKGDLTGEKLIEFNNIKDKKQKEYIDNYISQVRDIRRNIIGR